MAASPIHRSSHGTSGGLFVGGTETSPSRPTSTRAPFSSLGASCCTAFGVSDWSAGSWLSAPPPPRPSAARRFLWVGYLQTRPLCEHRVQGVPREHRARPMAHSTHALGDACAFQISGSSPCDAAWRLRMSLWAHDQHLASSLPVQLLSQFKKEEEKKIKEKLKEITKTSAMAMRAYCLVKCFPQVEQPNGISRVWLRMWRVRCSLRVNRRWQ